MWVKVSRIFFFLIFHHSKTWAVSSEEQRLVKISLGIKI